MYDSVEFDDVIGIADQKVNKLSGEMDGGNEKKLTDDVGDKADNIFSNDEHDGAGGSQMGECEAVDMDGRAALRGDGDTEESYVKNGQADDDLLAIIRLIVA